VVVVVMREELTPSTVYSSRLPRSSSASNVCWVKVKKLVAVMVVVVVVVVLVVRERLEKKRQH
jgi:hypothetical protein